MLKKVCILTLILFLCFNVIGNFLLAEERFEEPTIKSFKIITRNSGSNDIRGITKNVWGSVKLILRIAALTTLLFTGIRYMMSSADQKADLKKSLIVTCIGVVLVFGTTYIIDFIKNISDDVLKVN